VLPLISWLRGVRTFAEPCCGDGALVRHLESFGLRCAYAGDIATGQDAFRPGASPKGPPALKLQPTQVHRHDLSETYNKAISAH
jgi:hypothetical protein